MGVGEEIHEVAGSVVVAGRISDMGEMSGDKANEAQDAGVMGQVLQQRSKLFQTRS